MGRPCGETCETAAWTWPRVGRAESLARRPGPCGVARGDVSAESLAETAARSRFLFEFHADGYKSLGLPVIPSSASSGTIRKLLKIARVCI